MNKYDVFIDDVFFEEISSEETEAEAALMEFFRDNQVEPEYIDRDGKGNFKAVMWTGTYTIFKK